MEKTIEIDGKQVRLKSTAALPMRYKAQFRSDYYGDLMKMAKAFGLDKKKTLDLSKVDYNDLDHFNLDVLYNIIWTMAKTADPAIPDPMTWLDEFDVFPLEDIFPEINKIKEKSMQTSKKK